MKNRTNKNPKNTINNYKLTNWTNYKKWTSFQKLYNPPKLNQDEIDTLNRQITRSETESVIEKKKKKPPCKQKSRTRWLHWEILPNIQRNYTDPSQTLPTERRRNIHYKKPRSPDTKIRQRQYKKKIIGQDLGLPMWYQQ